MLRRIIASIALPLFLLSACVEKPDPVVPDDPIEEPEQPEKPEQPEQPEEPKDKDVTLMSAFSEEFSALESEYFDFGYRQSGDDFRFYSGFPSLSESGNTILMLRLDPADEAGKGAVLTSKDYTYYGSDSVRLRIPDVLAVQSKLGACVQFALYDEDEVFGTDEVSLSIDLIDRTVIRTFLSRTEPGGSPVTVDETIAPELSGFDASSKYYVYGFDWSEGKIVWWFKTKPSGDMTVLK